MTPLPAWTCDTHVHVYDGRYPSASTATLFPPDASVEDYRDVQTALGIRRVVLVQPTTYGRDNACQIDAAARLGDDARLVLVVDESVTDHELERATALGARGARFHMLPGGAIGWSALRPVADHIAAFGWHVQLQLDGNTLPAHADVLRDLPTELVIDHVGRFMPPPGPGDASFRVLLDLLDLGRCWVKLSAPYESTGIDAPIHPAVTELVRVLVDRFPERLLWATNWPHPGRDDPPTVDDLHRQLLDWLPSDDLRRQVLVDNPAILYGFDR